jgi:MoxR-like ATPase
MREAAADIYVSLDIRKYMIDIVKATRRNPNISSGVSPRGTLALLKACQIYAAIKGRDYVIPEDVKILAIPVLSHRIVSYTNMAKNSNKANIIRGILEQTPAPTENFKATVQN